MKSTFRLSISLLCISALLFACAKKEEEPKNPTPPANEAAAPSEPELPPEEKPKPRETKGVTYTGTVKPAGISIYQEGTHRLVLSDGKFILLESGSVDLNGYVGEKADLYGAIRPTVEEGGMIMRVERIGLSDSAENAEDEEGEGAEFPSLDEEESEGDEEESTVEASGETEESEPEVEEVIKEDTEEESEEVAAEETATETEEVAAVPEAVTEENEEVAASSASSEETEVEEEPAEEEVVEEEVEEEAEASPPNPALQARIDAIAKENLAAERWTQEYCTSHIGFCIPVHKNWWFKSFGNTTADFWHVELSNEEIESIGDGPIAIKLVNGTVGSKKATNKQVRTQGNIAIGFRTWRNNQHFQITADAALIEVVRYITDGLREQSE